MTPRWSRSLMLVALATIFIAAADVPSLIDAVKNSDKTALRSLLKQGANVNTAAADGTMALHWASYRDDLESADMLIRAGAKVNAANDLGATPLWTASLNGSAAMVRRLLQAGADPNQPLLLGETPLMVAARAGSPDIVEQLLAKGAKINAAHAELAGIAVRRDAQGAAAEQADPVEVLGGQVVDVRAEGGKLLLIQGTIIIGLSHVLREDGQFTHAIQGLADLLQEPVAGLAEGDGIAHVGVCRLGAVDLRVEDHELLEDWGNAVRKNRGIPARNAYYHLGQFDHRTFERRFGPKR